MPPFPVLVGTTLWWQLLGRGALSCGHTPRTMLQAELVAAPMSPWRLVLSCLRSPVFVSGPVGVCPF